MRPAHLTIVVIGLSHLLQPPITLWLAKRVLGLSHAFATLPTLASRIAQILGATAIAFPTSLGLLCAACADAALVGGPVRLIALCLSGLFWTPRLFLQLFWVGSAFPPDARKWHWLLVAIFLLQGPVFFAILNVGAT